DDAAALGLLDARLAQRILEPLRRLARPLGVGVLAFTTPHDVQPSNRGRQGKGAGARLEGLFGRSALSPRGRGLITAQPQAFGGASLFTVPPVSRSPGGDRHILCRRWAQCAVDLYRDRVSRFRIPCRARRSTSTRFRLKSIARHASR